MEFLANAAALGIGSLFLILVFFLFKSFCMSVARVVISIFYLLQYATIGGGIAFLVFFLLKTWISFEQYYILWIVIICFITLYTAGAFHAIQGIESWEKYYAVKRVINILFIIADIFLFRYLMITYVFRPTGILWHLLIIIACALLSYACNKVMLEERNRTKREYGV